ncbi:MAG: T9SS type A sorting domain-containing protein, partial [Bacteroidetes bacterium]|nr:T9SS type A sorting domain-containing protein [Bacteroidota bacterium]
ANYLTLDMGSYDLSNLSFQLFDINGRLIESKEIEGNKTSIRMDTLVPATYFIRVIQDNKEVKTFKIIKK